MRRPLIALMLAALAACGRNGSSDHVVIGHYGSMSGAEATFGQATARGIRLAVKEANAAGGIQGKLVELRSYDDRGQSQEAGTAVTRLIANDKAIAVLGHNTSSLSLAGGRVAQQYGVPMISPSSTNPSVTQLGDKIFRVCFLDPYQGWVQAKFAREHLKAAKAAILYDQGQAYSKGLAEFFRTEFEKLGGTIATEQAYTGGDQDFSAQLTTIRQSGPDLVIVPGYYTDAGNIAIQARKLGLTAPLLGGDGWESPQLAAIGKEAIEGSYYSCHYAYQEDRPEVAKFVAAYESEYGEKPDSLGALGYDAAGILFDAMRRADSWDGATLAKAIAGTKDFAGVTGRITIDAERNARKSAVVVQMKAGVPVAVTTIEPETSGSEATSFLGRPLISPPPDESARVRMEEQLAEARAALARAQNDPDAWIWVGRRLGYLGRYREAVGIFSDGIARFPDDARFYRHRGHRYITLRQLDRAIADLDRAARLTTGRPDEIEPDGQPNARNIPTTTLQSNIRYHLALAHYLKGDFVEAARVWREGRDAVRNPDNLVSTTHWLYLSLRRAGRDDEALRVLEPITADLDVIENDGYHALLLMYKGVRSADDVLKDAGTGSSAAAVRYGVSAWYLMSGRKQDAERLWGELAAQPEWAPFGVIAAEAELARL